MKKTSYQLPENQRQPLNRMEISSARWLVAAQNSISHSAKELEARLDCIPNGNQRFRLMLGQLLSILNDLFGTIPEKQRYQIGNTMNDNKLSMIPKYTPDSNKVIMDAKDLAFIVYHCQKDEELCPTCIMDGEECRNCKLFQILSTIAPRQDWGNWLLCPYNGDWAGK